MSCPSCGSTRPLNNKGIKGKKRRFQCRDCGHYVSFDEEEQSTVFDWIEKNLLLHGEGYIRTNYTALVTDLGPVCTPEDYLSLVRKVIQRVKRTLVPKESYEVSSISGSLDYHNVNTSDLQITKATVNSWGSPKNPNQQVKLTLTPKKVPTTQEMVDEFKRSLTEFSLPEMPVFPRPLGNYMLEMNIPDAHFGQLSWGEETGRGDWDISIARDVYLETVSRMLEWASSRPVEKILFPIGHDFFNSDTSSNTTTAGTPQTEDTRWMKTFSAGWQLVRDAILLIASRAPVDVVCIRGNHDDQRSFYMTEVLASWFRDHNGVTVDNSPRTYKIREYGLNLIGLTHGHASKIDTLPLLMANDWSEAWGRTKFREWHIGHFHQDSVREFPGCKVITIPSIVSASEWSATMGMRSQRGARAFLWHKDHGRTETFDYTPILMSQD